MSKKTENPFIKYETSALHTIKVKALGNAPITFREPTIAEEDMFNVRLLNGAKISTNADAGSSADDFNIDFEVATEVKYEKVSLLMIQPEMTVEQLKNLSRDASEAINEIFEAMNSIGNNRGGDTDTKSKKN